MTGLTTHVLDLTLGKPADGLRISFFKIEQDNKNAIAKFVTNSDGRLDSPIFDQSSIRAGWYEMVFHAGKYLMVKQKMIEADLFFDNIWLFKNRYKFSIYSFSIRYYNHICSCIKNSFIF